jgi:lipopolysaccharide transport system ATP-binding protein
MEPIVISASGVSKRYQLSQGAPWFSFRQIKKLLRKNTESIEAADEFWALKDISFQVKKGQRVGIIGRNGAGKSTLLKILSRLVYPTEGEIIIHGRVTSLLEVGTGFNMNLSGRDNIYLNASLHGLEKQEIDAIFNEIVDFSGVGDFLDLPVKNYSSGMYMRLAFSVAAHLEPDILLMDEVLAVGDLSFQQKCLQRMESLASTGRTIVLVSHSMGDISRFCNHVIWIDKGKIRFSGDVLSGIEIYNNEMTPQQSAQLEHRIDRSGTGSARLTRVQVMNDENINVSSVKTGDNITLACEYRMLKENIKPKDVFINIVIENSKKQRIFGLPSEVLDTDLTDLSTEGTFYCQIMRLPLVPGIYYISVALLLDRQLVDKVVDANKLVVMDGDYYGTQRLPLKSFGEICVDFSWGLDKKCGF